MKNKLQLALIACAVLVTTTNVHAAPKRAGRYEAQVHALCQNKDTRIMMIRELMNSEEGRQEMARMLERSEENVFRSYYEIHTVNPG